MTSTHNSDEQTRLEQLIDKRHYKPEGRGAGVGYVKPKLAATIVIVKGESGREKILMGKRNANLKFMPGALVFPGGRLDRMDYAIDSASPLPEPISAKLQSTIKASRSPNVGHAFGIAAVRELNEETGLIIGEKCNSPSNHEDWTNFAEQQMAPSLSGLRLLGRAVTPTGGPRRFDTWFFICRSDAITYQPDGGFAPSGELEELAWLDIEEAIAGKTRDITKVLLVELKDRLKKDPELSEDYKIPSYQYRNGFFSRKLI